MLHILTDVGITFLLIWKGCTFVSSRVGLIWGPFRKQVPKMLRVHLLSLYIFATLSILVGVVVGVTVANTGTCAATRAVVNPIPSGIMNVFVHLPSKIDPMNMHSLVRPSYSTGLDMGCVENQFSEECLHDFVQSNEVEICPLCTSACFKCESHGFD